ncbi:MAG TPA: hypothetical protein VJU14_10985 [Solirubrobacterales bacterium]|nr:hypothetical protein [Solirubrobacterales bacterium]
MHDKPIGAGCDRAATTAAEDTRDQAAVLRHVLDLHPETLTLDELMREMVGVLSSRFSEEDGIRRAVRDLAAVGLLHHEGQRVIPTRAALVFHNLNEA